jgi:beta-lactamase superfamily II metal-dependent hydrolase
MKRQRMYQKNSRPQPRACSAMESVCDFPQNCIRRAIFEIQVRLITQDIWQKTEQQVARESPQADLQVAHHGSATSTIPELLAAVHPRFAVISVGVRNVNGHPRREVLERLEEAHVITYRTDMDGAVTFYLDGKTVTSQLAAPH